MNQGVNASAYLKALHAARVDHFVTVPDYVQLALHQHIEAGEPGIRLVRTSNEDQAVCTAAGLTIGGKRPIVVLQNQGFYACVNALRAITLDAQIPTVLLIGQFGREHANYGQDMRRSRRRMVSLLLPMLETMGIPHWTLETEGDLAQVATAFETAHRARGAAALIVGTPTAWH